MKHMKTMLRVCFILAIVAVLALPVLAADDLYITPSEVTGGEVVTAVNNVRYASSMADMTMSDAGIAFICGYEGFTPNPMWDVSRYSIGYGCSYEECKKMFGEDCAPITKEQGMELLKAEMVGTEKYMNNFFTKNSISLNQNQYDAIMSFTYNVGIGWTTYKNSDGTWCRLKTLLLSDPSTWTAEAVQGAFGTWVNAGGVELPGLVKRRAAEAKLFVTPCEDVPETETPETPEVPETETPETPPTEPETDAAPEEETAPKPSFTDVTEDKWYYDEVSEAHALGLVNGMGNGTFCPEGALTRAQMVRLLYNFEGLEEPEDQAESPFSDVPAGKWYTGEIIWAVENGYVNGIGDGTFRPNDPVTREQMCAIIARYLQSKGYFATDEVEQFTDEEEMSSYATFSIYYCASLGIVKGMGNGAFAPKSGATRAQAATILVNMYGQG